MNISDVFPLRLRGILIPHESRNLQKKQADRLRSHRQVRNRSLMRLGSGSDPLTLHDAWRPSWLVPANPSDVLDYDAKDSRDIPATPEAEVKALLLETLSSLSGVSGIGKSCVLRALPHDPQVKKRLLSGFCFLSFVVEASVDAIMKHVTDLVRLIGGAATSSVMETLSEVDSVLEEATAWFQNKPWLHLVDDICDGNLIDTDTLSKLFQVVDACRSSATAFATRDGRMAFCGTKHVRFAPKETLGEEACQILLTFAKFDEESVKDNACEEPIETLLRKCC